MTPQEMLAQQFGDIAQLRQIIGDLGEAARKTNEAVSLLLGQQGEGPVQRREALVRQGEALARRGEALARQREALIRLDEVVRRAATARSTSAWNEAIQAAQQTRLAVALDEPKISVALDEPKISALLDEAIRHIDHAKATVAAVEARAERSSERPA